MGGHHGCGQAAELLHHPLKHHSTVKRTAVAAVLPRRLLLLPSNSVTASRSLFSVLSVHYQQCTTVRLLTAFTERLNQLKECEVEHICDFTRSRLQLLSLSMTTLTTSTMTGMTRTIRVVSLGPMPGICSTADYAGIAKPNLQPYAIRTDKYNTKILGIILYLK